MKPSDAVNQRALGLLGSINPAQEQAIKAESVAIAIEVQKELDRVSALTGTLTPTLWGNEAGPGYTYPVQTYTAGTTNLSSGPYIFNSSTGSALWSNTLTSNPVQDIIAAASMLLGKAED